MINKCNRTNFFFITSFSLSEDEDYIVVGTNQPIASTEIPNCLSMRISSCTTRLSGYETLPLKISVNGEEVNMFNKYGERMTYGQFILTYSGCLNRRYTYRAYIGDVADSESVDIIRLTINNAPRQLVN